MLDFKCENVTVLEFSMATEAIDIRTRRAICFNKPAIVEIAAVKIERGKIIRHYSEYVALEIDNEKAKLNELDDLCLNGVTSAHIIGARSMKEAVISLHNFVADDTVVLRGFYLLDKRRGAYGVLKDHALSYGYVFNNPVINLNTLLLSFRLNEEMCNSDSRDFTAAQTARVMDNRGTFDEMLARYDIPFETEGKTFLNCRRDALGWALAIAQLITALSAEGSLPKRLEEVYEPSPFGGNIDNSGEV